MPAPETPSPFNLIRVDDYRRWRELKLATGSLPIEDLVVSIRDPAHPSDAEAASIRAICGHTN